MPIYNAPVTAVDLAETLRYAGMKETNLQMEEAARQACEEALVLIQPRSSWQIWPYDSAGGVIIAKPPLILQGNGIKEHLRGAMEVAVLTVTVGRELEAAAEKLFAQGEYTAGLLLDAAGSAAVEQEADALNHMIAVQGAKRGLVACSRFSPGYGDWAVTVQPELLVATGGAEIGVTVTESCMLVPRKSITAVIGLVPFTQEKISERCGRVGCSACRLTNCMMRKE